MVAIGLFVILVLRAFGDILKGVIFLLVSGVFFLVVNVISSTLSFLSGNYG